MDHNLILGKPFAVSMHPTVLRRIASHKKGYIYLQTWEVAARFRDLFAAHGLDPKNEKIVVAGKNYASFDARFLRELTGWDKYIKVRHRILDPAVLYWQPEIDGVELPDTETCMQRAGNLGEVAHTAIEDATVVVRLIRRAVGDRQPLVVDDAVPAR